MPSSSEKVTSNRMNAQKSKGPNDTTSARFNAIKHSLLAVGITELDEADGYQTTLSELISEKAPVGMVETFLVKSIALDMVRWSRARRLEADYITAALNPPLYEKTFLGAFDSDLRGAVIDPGLPAALGAGHAQTLVSTYQRYETLFANRLFKTIHELERMQKMRQSERMPAPAAIDVSSTSRIATANVAPTSPEQQPKTILSDDESLPKPVTVDVIDAGSEVVASAAADLDQEKTPPADDENFTAVAGITPVNLGSAPAGQAGQWSSTPPSGPLWMKANNQANPTRTIQVDGSRQKGGPRLYAKSAR